MSESIGNTQPLKPVKKAPRWRSILIGVLGVIVLLALAGFGGYESAIGTRVQAKTQLVNQQLMDQFQRALVDEQFKHYDDAKQRLNFIIQNDPSFPGAQTEMTKLLIIMSIPTATLTPTLTPTPDVRGQQAMITTAQQLIAASSWANALTELDQLRKKDPSFNASQVDGMYYYALRNYGVDLITKQGNLEGGVYELDLASRFAPLDHDAKSLYDGAELYIDAASFWQVDWATAANELAQVYTAYPAMWDGTMSAAQRYQIAAERYGDQLFSQSRFCDATKQYQAAQAIGNMDQTASRNFTQAYIKCYPPTAVPVAPVAPVVTP
jgi:tetratricopeptide (TPR) repeat protein